MRTAGTCHRKTLRVSSPWLALALIAAAGCGKPPPVEEADLAGIWEGAVRWRASPEDELRLDWPTSPAETPTWSLAGGTVSGLVRANSRRPDAIDLALEQRLPCPGEWRLRGLVVEPGAIDGTLEGYDCERVDMGAVTMRRLP